MYIKIGKYKDHWIGPYQIASTLKYVGVSEDNYEKIGEYLNSTYLKNICEFIYDNNPFKQRKVKIRIDKWDTWNMDHTLALIIVPMLKQLKETKHGSPLVADEHVPDELKSTNAKPKEKEYDLDEFHHARWDYVMNEMIFAFESIADSDWEEQFWVGYSLEQEGYKAYEKRIDNGLKLFGIYYRGLWD